MVHLKHNFSLKSNNTFGISAIAKHYLTVDSELELIQYFGTDHQEKNEKRLFLGAGSNLLFLGDFDGLVIHPDIQSINLIANANNLIEVEVGAGVVWDDFVKYCVGMGWYGIENLSLIPGNVGAVPVQNIGAYGVEAESVIVKVTGIDMNTLKIKSFDHPSCGFSYRNSVFKEKLKEQLMVTSVVFRLSKHPDFKLNYGSLETEVLKYGEKNLSNVRKAVIAIRESKLPNPQMIGNAGSFFKNPVVPEQIATMLKNSYPELPFYPFGAGYVKIAAGWLIEKAGWKGKSFGHAAVHDKQALVIINKGGASGREIFELSEMVASDVLQIFNIALEREVQVVG